MSSPGRHEGALAELPADPAGLARVIQGLLLHEHWAPSYGVTLSDERRAQSHIRPLAEMLDRLVGEDGRPLAEARELDHRLVGICRHFALFLAAALRAHGVPARARCGFGAYFIPRQFEDHWVCEYWNAAERRWILADAQIDAHQRSLLNIDFDSLDVPRDRFIIAGDAWAQCRRGDADAGAFGIFHMRGLWFISGNVVRDYAALNHMEMLPWDAWGAMLAPDATATADQLALLDRLAALAQSSDAAHAELRALYERDDGVRVPATVFNAVRLRPEDVVVS